MLAEAGCTIDDVVEVTVFLWIRSSISNGPGRSCPSSGASAPSRPDRHRCDLAAWLPLRDQGDREVAGRHAPDDMNNPPEKHSLGTT
nr:hypothetical protein [Pseudoxanthomonas sp.]